MKSTEGAFQSKRRRSVPPNKNVLTMSLFFFWSPTIEPLPRPRSVFTRHGGGGFCDQDENSGRLCLLVPFGARCDLANTIRRSA